MSQHYSITCPNCAAPLDLIGGGRIQSVTCNYCKSLIELGEEYKVLSDFKNAQIPEVPFKIGMQGKINKIEWTIIGWIVYRSYDEWEDRWSEFLLFSPLYGYGWLIYEAGVISFSRRIRDFNLRTWQITDNAIFYRGGHYLLKEMSYRSVIDFVQGELTWIAKYQDQIECWDYKGIKGAMLNIEKSNNELEVYHTQRLDAKTVYEAFEITSENQIIKNESLIEKLEETRVEKNGLMLFGIANLALILFVMIFASLKNSTILDQKIDVSITLPFAISSEAFLQEIHLKSSSNTYLNNYQITLKHHNQELLYIDKQRASLNHKKFDNTWNYRAIGANIYLKLDKGEYQLILNKVNPKRSSPLHVIIEEKVIKTTYIVPLFLLMLAFLLFARWRT